MEDIHNKIIDDYVLDINNILKNQNIGIIIKKDKSNQDDVIYDKDEDFLTITFLPSFSNQQNNETDIILKKIKECMMNHKPKPIDYVKNISVKCEDSENSIILKIFLNKDKIENDLKQDDSNDEGDNNENKNNLYKQKNKINDYSYKRSNNTYKYNKFPSDKKKKVINTEKETISRRKIKKNNNYTIIEKILLFILFIFLVLIIYTIFS